MYAPFEDRWRAKKSVKGGDEEQFQIMTVICLSSLTIIPLISRWLPFKDIFWEKKKSIKFILLFFLIVKLNAKWMSSSSFSYLLACTVQIVFNIRVASRCYFWHMKLTDESIALKSLIPPPCTFSKELKWLPHPLHCPYNSTVRQEK